MTKIEKIQFKWDEVCDRNAIACGGELACINYWVRFVRGTLGADTTFEWDKTFCKLNGVLIFPAPEYMIPASLYAPRQHRTSKNFAVQSLNAELLARAVVV